MYWQSLSRQNPVLKSPGVIIPGRMPPLGIKIYAGLESGRFAWQATILVVTPHAEFVHEFHSVEIPRGYYSLGVGIGFHAWSFSRRTVAAHFPCIVWLKRHVSQLVGTLAVPVPLRP